MNNGYSVGGALWCDTSTTTLAPTWTSGTITISGGTTANYAIGLLNNDYVPPKPRTALDWLDGRIDEIRRELYRN